MYIIYIYTHDTQTHKYIYIYTQCFRTQFVMFTMSLLCFRVSFTLSTPISGAHLAASSSGVESRLYSLFSLASVRQCLAMLCNLQPQE